MLCKKRIIKYNIKIVKYYENNKERLQKKLVKYIEVFLKKKKKKKDNMVVNNTKI